MNPRIDLRTCASDEALAEMAASEFLSRVQAANHESAAFTVALSGGRIARKFYNLLSKQAATQKLAFGSVHFFWADERCVPPEDLDSNYRVAREFLFEPAGVGDGQIHRIRGELEPVKAARQAEAELKAILQQVSGGKRNLDLVILGMGEDGHVASLFPAESTNASAKPSFFHAVTDSPKPPPCRVTLGYQAIAIAKEVWTLVSGAGKKSALAESISPTGKTPLARVIQMRAKTLIMTDFPPS